MGSARFDEFAGAGEDISEKELVARIRAAQARDTAPKKPEPHQPEQRDRFAEADAISADAARRAESDRKMGLRQGQASNAKEAFTTQLAESTVDTLVSPVTVPARVANAIGFKNTIADDITGARLVENVNELRDGRVPAQTRRDRAADRTVHDFATTAGQFTGEALGGAAPAVGMAAKGARDTFRALSPAVQRARSARTQRGALELPLPATQVPMPLDKLQEAQADAFRARNIRELRNVTPERADELKEIERATVFNARLKLTKIHPDGDALEDYTNTGYGWLNEELRGGAPSVENLEKANRLSRFLEDARAIGLTYDGDTTRGLDLPDHVLNEWMEKGAVRNESFWSTTTDTDTRDFFLDRTVQPGHKRVQLQLQQSSGVPIGGYEDEVLIPRGRNWMVDGTEIGTGPQGRPITILKLREVPALPPGVVPAVSAVALGVGEAARRRSSDDGRR
jgi:hypothetical protein